MLALLAWFYLVPHYNGKEYTFWIGTTSTPEAGSPLPRVTHPVVHTNPSRQPTMAPKRAVPAPSFMPSSSFQGGKDGYVFKNDNLGLGYYKDSVPPSPRVRFASKNQMQSYKTTEPPNHVTKGL